MITVTWQFKRETPERTKQEFKRINEENHGAVGISWAGDSGSCSVNGQLAGALVNAITNSVCVQRRSVKPSQKDLAGGFLDSLFNALIS